MDLPIPDWATFKSLCIVKKVLNCQYYQDAGSYTLIGPDNNGLNWVYGLPKTLGDGTVNPDATDFESNFRAEFNGPIGKQGAPFAASILRFTGKGFNFQAAANSATTAWFALPMGYYLNGGEYFTIGAVAGDTVQVDVVDKNGVTGAPPGTVLATPPYFASWNIPPQDGVVNDILQNYATLIPAPIYLRFVYTSTGLVLPVGFYCNVYLHKTLT